VNRHNKEDEKQETSSVSDEGVDETKYREQEQDEPQIVSIQTMRSDGTVPINIVGWMGELQYQITESLR
jgi:hypothetical protein